MAGQTVKKSSHRAGVNFPTGSEDITYKKPKKRQINKAKKMVKGVGVKGWLIAFLVLLIGAGAGVGSYFLVCKNDDFKLLGKEELIITTAEKYVDEGVSIIAFGKDISSEVKIDTDMKQDSNGNFYSDVIGTHYITYYTTELKYGSIFKVQKIRLVTVVEASEAEEANSANDTTEGVGA